MPAIRPTDLVDRYVLIAFVVQVVGFAALQTWYPHGQESFLTASLRALPTPVLLVLSVPAIPAVALALGFGATVEVLGIQPESIPALLVARGDVLVFLGAYLLAVGVSLLYRRVDVDITG